VQVSKDNNYDLLKLKIEKKGFIDNSSIPQIEFIEIPFSSNDK